MPSRKHFLNATFHRLSVLFLRLNTPYGQILKGLCIIFHLCVFIFFTVLLCFLSVGRTLYAYCAVFWRNKRMYSMLLLCYFLNCGFLSLPRLEPRKWESD